jgi:hypothetical protein
MKARLFLVLLVLLPGATFSWAQEADYSEDMRFVEKLREEGLHDLALDYLKRLGENPPPELAKLLPLEIARTRLVTVQDEPDSKRRLDQYSQILLDLENFLGNNPGHPLTSEVQLDIARVTSLKGQTQLSQALILDTKEDRVAQGLEARKTLVQAGQMLRLAANDLKAKLEAMPEPKTREEAIERARVEEEQLRAELAVALNVVDQVETYLDEDKIDVLQARGKKVAEAIKALEPLAGGNVNRSVTWIARAWLGRCYDFNGNPKEARKKYAEILNTPARAADDGKRLARYFYLLAFKQTVDPDEQKRLPQTIIREAGSWIRDYPRHWNTPEGHGIRYLLAQTLIAQAKASKIERQKQAYLAQARGLLRQVERTENNFTERARRLKIGIIQEQGGFAKKVDDLTSFEDCYVRAQYEVMMMGKDPETIKDDKELEEKRKQRIDTILAALDRGLTLPDAKDPGVSLEVHNAQAMLAFYSLGAGKYEQAIRVGEGFARSDPRSSQAATSAVYALQAYNQIIKELQKKFEDASEDTRKMLELASYMESRWPKELAGNMARHQTGLYLLRQGKLGEAIQKLATIQPTYSSYVFVQAQLGEAALKAEQDQLEPLPGEKQGDYRKRGLQALEAIPLSALGSDPSTNYIVLVSKATLGREWFKDQKYEDMDKLAGELLPQIDQLPFSEDSDRNAAVKSALKQQLQDIQIYAHYGLARADLQAGKFDAVAARIDPLVDRLNNGELTRLKDNIPLATALLNMDLKANVQLRKPEQIKKALLALQMISGEDNTGTTGILNQLVLLIRQQIEELRKAGDEEQLKQAISAFTAVLDDLKADPKLKPDAEFHLYLAHCYAGMGKHDKAVDTLDKVPPLVLPPENVQKEMGLNLTAQDLAGIAQKIDDQLEGSLQGLTPAQRTEKLEPIARQINDELKIHKGVRLLLLRELRLTEEPENIDKAWKVLKEIQGSDRKSWGGKNLEAIKEEIYLAAAKKNYAYGAKLAQQIIQLLLRKGLNDNTLKKLYFEFYYLHVYCYLRHGQQLNEVKKRANAMRQAAAMLVSLEQKWGGFGSAESTARFKELLDKDPEFKALYESMKNKK